MAIKQYSPKQPFDKYYLAFDFSNDLSFTSTIISSIYSITAYDITAGADATELFIDETMQRFTDKFVYFMVMGGVHNHDYKITCRITSSDGSRFELEGIVPVREV